MIKGHSKLLCIITGVCILIVLSLTEVVYSEIEELKFLPAESDGIILIKNNPDDPGLSFVMNLWRERFEIREYPEKYTAIKELYAELPLKTIAGAIFLPDKPYNEEGEPIYSKFIVIIKITGEDDIFREALNILIKKRKPLKEVNYEGYRITYRDKKLEPFHGQKDLAAYTQIDDFFLIATSPKELRLAIDTYRGEVDSVSKNEEFVKLEGILNKGDAFIFANNKDKMFSDNLRRWEEKEGMRLLLSSESINSAGLSFDLETNDAVSGKIIFIPKSTADITSIEDDAYFFAEVIGRSFTKENINWISNIDITHDFVKLEFEGVGFKPVWEEALLRKNIAFLEEESEEKEEKENQSINSTEKISYSNIPKIIFVVVVTIFALGIVMLLMQKKKMK